MTLLTRRVPPPGFSQAWELLYLDVRDISEFLSSMRFCQYYASECFICECVNLV